MYVYNVPQPTRRLTSLGKQRGREYKTRSHRVIHTLFPALGKPEISSILELVEMGYAAWVGDEQEEERTTFAEWIYGGSIHTYVLRNGAGVICLGGGLYRAEDFRSYPPTGLTVIILSVELLMI